MRRQDNGWLLFAASAALFGMYAGAEAGGQAGPSWGCLAAVLAALAAAVCLRLLGMFFRLLLRCGTMDFLSFLLLCVTAFFMLDSVPEMGKEACACLSLAFGLIAAAFFKSLGEIPPWGRGGIRPFVILAVTAPLLLGTAILLASDGFRDTYVEAYLELAGEARDGGDASREEGTDEDFPSYVSGGAYEAASLTYGPRGEDLASGYADISGFAKNKGIQGRIKEAYQGYPLTDVPMRGVIWYPKDKSLCPTVFLAHGNHSWMEDSYLGYGYLGKYLASCGYVVVSVDENACNLLNGENDGRAVLLLENMRQVARFNDEEGGPLFHKMDFSNLALAGHSRGGETVALACRFNELSYYPDNGNHAFRYHFSIKSLIALAPTYGQYHPSGRSVGLTDVNYLVLQGANDQDVRTFQGMGQYGDVRFTGEKRRMKAAIYVAGLNHGQFNSRWGRHDLAGAGRVMLNVRNFLSRDEQQEIAKVFVRAFLDETMDGMRSLYPDLLTDCGKYREYLPKTLYSQRYAMSGAEAICDFEEDMRLETGTMEGVSIRASHVNSWGEERSRFSAGGYEGNHEAVISWNRGAADGTAAGKDGGGKKSTQVAFSCPALDASGSSLQLDLMDLREGLREEEARPMEVMVSVKDASGRESSVWLGNYATVYPPFLARLNKWQYLTGGVEEKPHYQTVSIPFRDFQGIDISKIKEITLRFLDREGKAAIDDVRIQRPREIPPRPY